MRGVSHPESVAEHTFCVAFLAMILAESIEEEVDRGRLLTIALLHDLGEAFTTDLPEPALRSCRRESKDRPRKMIIQAYVYEQSTGNRNLDEFWKFMEHYSILI